MSARFCQIPPPAAHRLSVALDIELAMKVPGMDFLALAVAPGAGGTVLTFSVSSDPFSFKLEDAPIVLRVDADLLCPLKAGTNEPDPNAKTLDIVLGKVDLGIDADGHVQLDVSGASLPRCMIGTSGVILSVTNLEWLSPGSPNLPIPGFTGLHFDGATIELADLPINPGKISMTNVYLGTGGFTGVVNWTDTSFTWDGNAEKFTGAVAGELLGFMGGLSSIQLEFRQSALVGCEITRGRVRALAGQAGRAVTGVERDRWGHRGRRAADIQTR
jgi:hypothetical protein